jgi:Leucine-rich repeat (LRR) protein
MSYQSIEESFTQFPDDVEEIYVNFISDHLPDLSRFYKLKILWCCINILTSLPPLPSTLKILHISYNKLTSLPPLPSTLKELYCFNNQLTYLPPLPSTLERLYCSNNQLTSLPPLPSNLNRLNCYYNQLTYLPLLPSTLKSLECSNNQLTSLPLLPYNLEQLYCCSNKLICLPLLPSTLEIFNCNNNPLPDYYIKKDKNMYMNEYITQLRNQINTVNHFRELFYALKYKKQFLDLLWVQIREPKIRNKYHPNNLITMLEGRDEITLDELDDLIDNW